MAIRPKRARGTRWGWSATASPNRSRPPCEWPIKYCSAKALPSRTRSRGLKPNCRLRQRSSISSNLCAGASGGSANDPSVSMGSNRRSPAKPLAEVARRYAASKSARELARWLGHQARRAVRGRKGRRLAAPNRWQKFELDLLGTAPDRSVARQIGRSLRAVYHKRHSLGLAPVPAIGPWTPEVVSLLGKPPDKEIARRVGLSYKAVHARRKALGVPYTAALVRPWTKEEELLLGTAPDAVIAQRLKRTKTGVAIHRIRSGIRGTNPNSRWGRRRRISFWDVIPSRQWRGGSDAPLARCTIGESTWALRCRTPRCGIGPPSRTLFWARCRMKH